MKKKKDYDPSRMLWIVVITNIIIILLFLALLAAISYFGHGELLN